MLAHEFYNQGKGEAFSLAILAEDPEPADMRGERGHDLRKADESRRRENPIYLSN